MTRLILSYSSLLLTFTLLYGCGKNEEGLAQEKHSEKVSMNEFYLTTSGESEKRANSVLPTEGTEYTIHALKPIELRSEEHTEPKQYLPSLSTEWVIQATLTNAVEVRKVAKAFDRKWRERYGGMTIYGRDIKNGRWTFLISADGPEQVDSLQFAWPYFATWSEQQQAMTPEAFRERLDAVKRTLSSVVPAEVRSSITPRDAAARAVSLSTLTEQLDQEVNIRLISAAGKPFHGREVWDVMLSLGLRWGDMDCFHWENPSGVGDDYFFSVWTSTAPGYFLPEVIATGDVAYEDLIFGFSISRTADPVVVFERMITAVRYAQKRLGGAVLMIDGQPLDESAVRRKIEESVAQLTASGFKPGSDNALRQF